jgi:DNA-directed RNA polymerase subunit beta
MNVGQIFETHLGWAARGLGKQITAALEEWRIANPNPEAAAPPTALVDRLKDIYGENYHAEIDARTTDEIVEMASLLKNGVPMGTPVFDGAREADVSAMLAGSILRARSRSTTDAPVTPSTARSLSATSTC